MPSYCCFVDPVSDYSEKKLDDISPSGYKYGFPLFNAPKKIGEFEVIQPLFRGFYGATYVVQDDLEQKKVLKVIPKNVYTFFHKDFKKECVLHARIAADSEHIVGINNKFETVVSFPDIVDLDCHVAVLDYVPGQKLKDVLDSDEVIDSSKIAQIAIDLFKLLSELQNKKTNHNDLHAENIILKELNDSNKRGDEINNYIKAIAIDLGSLSEESKSNESQRIGDLHQIARYLKVLSQKLLNNPESTNDNEYRLAILLDDQSRLISPKVENQTVIGFVDAIDAIKDTYRRTYHPWKDQLKLKKFSDSYNAQTLQPWYVPSLLVDPDNNWINQISNKGPLLITGMRGCGKTILLKALQFHARVVPMNHSEENNIDNIISRLKDEKYVGLYVSCTKLLDKLGKPSEEPLFEPFSRLFIAYTIEAIRALRHLNDLIQGTVQTSYYLIIREVLISLLKNKDVFYNINSDSSLENCLINILSSLSKGEDIYKIEISPSIAFPLLADSIKKCSSLWNNHYVLFLLDDVSTRYFYEENIADLLSSLIFQSESCAFKITSEAQTIEVLNSPGNIERARLGRDIESFDLGQKVYDKIRSDKSLNKGIEFIEKILIKRAKYFAGHPNIAPKQLLGDCSLKKVAENICLLSNTNDTKNKIYFGITALTGICVGDIGEIINLYESIIKHFDNKYPISPEKQSMCFRDLSSIRLYQLNRIKSKINLKDYAISFAEASHELLIKSAKNTPHRLRHYYSIYVKITSGSTVEQEKQFKNLIELIDAGIFVFTGGSISPRTLSSDTNPVKQFVLIYRKLYGITNFMSLQQADRFELSGDRLQRWLENPKNGKEILMEGLGNKLNDDEDSNDDNQTKEIQNIKKDVFHVLEPNLFDSSINEVEIQLEDLDHKLENKKPKVIFHEPNELSKYKFDYIITGLGFEVRAFHSMEIILNNEIKASQIICIKYKEKGYGDKIEKLIREKNLNYNLINYENVDDDLNLPENSNILCNVSGMAKNLIFNIINKALKNNCKTYFTHTFANTYYPTDKDINSYLERFSNTEMNYEILQHMTDELVKGEKGPYEIKQISSVNADELKKRVLIAFSSPKYERLFKIIDEREFDVIELITPNPEHPRDKLALIAAEITAKRFNYVKINKFDTNDTQNLLEFLIKRFYEYYVNQNYNIELAFTGSKRQTIVCSIFSTVYKVSKCWYVRPTNWDTDRFSQGTESTSFFHVEFQNG